MNRRRRWWAEQARGLALIVAGVAVITVLGVLAARSAR